MKCSKMGMKILFVLVFFYIIKPIFCFAEKEGTVAGSFLKQEIGARPMGMGGAFVAIADDVNSLYYNPAGLANISGAQISSMYLKGLTDTVYGFIGYAKPIKFLKRNESIDEICEALGFSIFTLQGGEIEINYLDGTSEKRIAEQDYILSLGYGRKIFSKGFIGISFKGIYSQLVEEYNNASFALDFGGLYKLPYKGFNAGISLQNLGGKIKYDEESDFLPLTGRCGVAYETNFRGIHNLICAIDVLKSIDSQIRENVGLEYNFKKMIAGRVGKRFGYDLGTITAGIGFYFDTIGLDYAWVGGEDWDSQHRVSLNFKFKNKFDKKVEKIINKRLITEEFRYSIDLLQRNQWQEAISSFEKILKKDPSYKLAKQYLDEAKQKVKEFAIKHYETGREHYSNDRWFEAFQSWEEALRLSGQKESRAKRGIDEINNKLNAIYKAGENAYNQGEYGEALKRWQEILTKYSEYLNVKEKIEITQVKIRSIQKEKQRKIVEDIVREGIKYYKKNDYLKAVEKWHEALMLDHKQKEAIYYINKLANEFFEAGMNLYKQNRFKEAICEWDKILKINPKYEKVKIFINKAKEEFARKIELFYKKGIEEYNQGNYMEALLLWEVIVDLVPTNSEVRQLYIEAHLAQGCLYYRKNMLEEAAIRWKKILKIDPKHEKALKYIKRAKTKQTRLRELNKE